MGTPVTVDALQRQYFDFLAHERRYSTHTVAAYQRDLAEFTGFMQQHLAAPLNPRTLTQLKARDLTSYLAHLHDRNLTRSSINRKLSAVRGWFTYLSQRHQLKNTAVMQFRGLRSHAPNPAALNEKQTRQLLAAITPSAAADWQRWRDYALLLVLYGMGLRISEALSLNWQDLNETLIIQGKGNKQRRVPLLPRVADALTQLRQLTPEPAPTAPIFITQHGRAKQLRLGPRYVQRLLEKLRQELNLPEALTPHALRHCFATHLLQGGADLRVVQELLGHASLSTTQRYLAKDHKYLLAVHSTKHPLNNEEEPV